MKHPAVFVPRALTIEAMEWDGSSLVARDVCDWVQSQGGEASEAVGGVIIVRTIDGDAILHAGGVVMRDGENFFSVLTGREFRNRYVQADRSHWMSNA
jgi:hypothetical protein